MSCTFILAWFRLRVGRVSSKLGRGHGGMEERTPPPASRAPPLSGEALVQRLLHLKYFTCEARPSPPHLPTPKHRPVVENGTFSTGPFVRNRREPRSGRPCEAPPTQDICLRGVRGPACRMETSPAPGSLWFLSPAGKELVRPQTHETPSSNTLPPRLCAANPKAIPHNSLAA